MTYQAEDATLGSGGHYNEELVIPDTAVLYGSGLDYVHRNPNDNETDSYSYILAQGYGEENLDVNNSFFATGQDILDYLQNGQKYYEIWSHSGANGHALSILDVGPRPEFFSYSEGKDLLGSGANM